MKKSRDNYSASYGHYLYNRPTSANIEIKKPNLNSSAKSVNSSYDFLNTLKAKLLVNSPKMLEKYKTSDI